MTWLLCDYGEVLSLAQPEADRTAIEAAAGRAGDGLWADYWAHRPDYDRGDLTAAAYWRAVLGHALPADRLGHLISVDIASWLHPNPETLAAAVRAAQRGLHLALFSNAPVEVADRIDGLGWLSGYSPRLFSCRLRAVKPEPAAYEAVLWALGAPASDIVFFDDRPANVTAAQAAGLRAELFRHPSQLDAVEAA